MILLRSDIWTSSKLYSLREFGGEYNTTASIASNTTYRKVNITLCESKEYHYNTFYMINPPENRADFLFFNFVKIFFVEKFREGDARAFAKTLDGYYF